MAEIYEKILDEEIDIRLKMKYRDWLSFPDSKFPFLGAILSKGGCPKYAYHTTHLQLVEIEIIPDEYSKEKFPHQDSISTARNKE